MARYRVFGTATVEVSTVVEIEDDGLDEGEIEELAFELAEREFGGIAQYAGMGDFNHLVGVCGEDDTIDCTDRVVFETFEEECDWQ